MIGVNKNRIRGIRQTIPSGYAIGRTTPGKGPAQLIPLSQLASSLQSTGSVPIAGGGSGPIQQPILFSNDDMSPNPGSGMERGRGWFKRTLDVLFGKITGTLIYRAAVGWKGLLPGSNGQVLTLSGGIPAWGAAGSASLNNRGVWSGTNAYNPGDVSTFINSAYLNYLAIAAPASSTALQWIGDVTLQTISTTNTTSDTAVSQSGNGFCDTNPTAGENTGKFYFEFLCSNLLDNNTFVGIAISGRANRMGGSALGPILTNFTGSGSGSFAGLTNNKRGAVAVDLTNKLFWITADVTASPIAWNGSTSNSPGAGTGGITITTSAMPVVYPYWETQTSANQKCILFTLASSFAISAIPSGFSAWSGGAAAPNISPDQDSAHWIGTEIPIDPLFSYEHLGGI